MVFPKFVNNWLSRKGYSQAIQIELKEAEIKKPTKLKALFLKFKADVISRNSELADPEYDLKTVRKAIEVESILRQAKEKYLGLVWKGGYSFTGKNAEAVQYVKTRMDEMGIITGMPTPLLLEQVADELISYHNAFLVVQRDAASPSGKPYVNVFGKRVNPIAGMFMIPASHVQPIIDGKTKRLLGWKVADFKDEDDKFFVSENVIHFYMSRSAGNRFGSPLMTPVLDDVRALRKMEENAEALVYQHAIPLLQYRVGTAEAPTEDDEEIEEVKAKIENADPHGMFVVPHNHEITAVGNGESPLDVERYLRYFRQRIISGLGLSGVAFGEGDSSNRGTATVLDKGLQDGAKKYQNTIRTFFDNLVIRELLQEGNFNIMDPEDQVHLFTPEIDVDTKITKENHTMTLYHGNVITEDEMRAELGRDPISDEQRKETHFYLIEVPKAIIGAGDEKYIAETGTTAGAANTGLKVPAGMAIKSRPANQFGVKKTSAPRKNDSENENSFILSSARTMYFEMSEKMSISTDDFITKMTKLERIDENLKDSVATMVNSVEVSTVGLLTSSFVEGYKVISSECQKMSMDSVDPVISKYVDFLHLLGNDATILLENLQRQKIVPTGEVFSNTITGSDVIEIFDTLRYRLSSICNRFTAMAFNTGMFCASASLGKALTTKSEDSKCPKANKVLEGVTDIEMIPPHGPNCKCRLEAQTKE